MNRLKPWVGARASGPLLLGALNLWGLPVMRNGIKVEPAMTKAVVVPILDIRRHIFGMNQIDFAKLVKVSQSTVSRWETLQLEPGLKDMRRIRKEAVRLRLTWKDSFFFDGVTVREDGNIEA